MNARICLITGATEGVGKATAIELARRGITVVMAARNPAKAEKVKWEIARTTGNADTDYIVADLASLEQVRQLTETFKEQYPNLDILINNAGVFLPARTVTVDGYETTFQVNLFVSLPRYAIAAERVGEERAGEDHQPEFECVHHGEARRGQPPGRETVLCDGCVLGVQALHAPVYD